MQENKNRKNTKNQHLTKTANLKHISEDETILTMNLVVNLR